MGDSGPPFQPGEKCDAMFSGQWCRRPHIPPIHGRGNDARSQVPHAPSLFPDLPAVLQDGGMRRHNAIVRSIDAASRTATVEWEGENSVTEGMSWDMLVPRDRPVV
eukprot:gene8449-5636_t